MRGLRHAHILRRSAARVAEDHDLSARWDRRCCRSTARARTSRRNVRARPLAITPFAEAIIPSHHYKSRGHAVAGQDLRALVLGTSLARSFDPIIPRTQFQAQLSHAFVQKVAGIRANRSRIDVEVGHALTRRLTLTFTENLKLTRVTFALNESLDVLGAMSKLVWGQNVHAHWGYVAGLSRRFRTGPALWEPQP